MADGTRFGIAHLACLGVALLLATSLLLATKAPHPSAVCAVSGHPEPLADPLGLHTVDPPVASDIHALAPPHSVVSQVAAILDHATIVAAPLILVCPLGTPQHAAGKASLAAPAPPVAAASTIDLDAADLVVEAGAPGTATAVYDTACRQSVRIELLPALDPRPVALDTMRFVSTVPVATASPECNSATNSDSSKLLPALDPWAVATNSVAFISTPSAVSASPESDPTMAAPSVELLPALDPWAVTQDPVAFIGTPPVTSASPQCHSRASPEDGPGL